jgi:hypothetical protein
LLSDIFYFKCSRVLFIFWQKSEAGKIQKEPVIATDHSALLRHNARALANQIVCYIPLIMWRNNIDLFNLNFDGTLGGSN